MPAKNSSADEDDDRWSTPIKHEQSLLTLQPALFLLKKPSNDLLLYYLRNCDENYFRIFKVKFKSFDLFSTSYILNTGSDPWWVQTDDVEYQSNNESLSVQPQSTETIQRMWFCVSFLWQLFLANL